MAGQLPVREGTHDPLHAKALVLEKDGVRVALVTLDLISTTRGLVEDARTLIEKQTGIPGKNVMISATHSHTGPVLWGRTQRDEVLGGSSQIAQDYIKDLPPKIAESVKKADAARKPARATFAAGREEGLAFNRRFHMADGSIGWNPGKKNPKIIRPPGQPTRRAGLFLELDKTPRPIASTSIRHAPRYVGGFYYWRITRHASKSLAR